ncbi:MAG: ComEC/Rec2 family competence protein [Devosiaceae bacterium]
MALNEPTQRTKRATVITLDREIRALAKSGSANSAQTHGPQFTRIGVFGQVLQSAEASIAYGHGPAWLVVAFGAGIVGYFALPSEPQLWALVGVLVLITVLSWRARYTGWLYPGLMALALVSGTALVTAKAQFFSTPQILVESVQQISGRVVRVEQRETNRARLTLDLLTLEDQSLAQTPHRARITVIAQAGEMLPGQRIEVLARLGPPPEPVMPGARNMRRELFFARIGATGFSYGRPTVIAQTTEGSLMQRVEHVRLSLAMRFAQALPGDTGALAATLLVGKRDGLSQESYEALRRAGLAHLLAISGMHMAMMTLSAIALMHLILAFSPSASATKRATRWAAGIGLVIASGYLLLSGAGTATQRAFIMITIALFAMVLTRRALTIRAVAFAAAIVLLLHPENLLGPSFQMSFAATLALVAVYGGLNSSPTFWRWRLAAQESKAIGAIPMWLRRPCAIIGGIAATSLIAGLATAPFAAFHFSVGAPLSLLGNVLALPLVSLIIMPAGLVALLLTPFALEAAPLALMGFGLDQVMVIARWVAAMEGSRLAIPAITPQALLLLTLAGCIAALMVGRARLLALPFLALIPVFGLLQPTPSILVERQGATVAILQDGAFSRSLTRGSRFTNDMWHQRLALDPLEDADIWTCDPLGCIATLGDQTIAHVVASAALAEDCRLASVLITALRVPESCPASLVIGEQMLRAHGAIALVPDAVSETGLRVWQTFAHRTRPWEQISD